MAFRTRQEGYLKLFLELFTYTVSAVRMHRCDLSLSQQDLCRAFFHYGRVRPFRGSDGSVPAAHISPSICSGKESNNDPTCLPLVIALYKPKITVV